MSNDNAAIRALVANRLDVHPEEIWIHVNSEATVNGISLWENNLTGIIASVRKRGSAIDRRSALVVFPEERAAEFLIDHPEETADLLVHKIIHDHESGPTVLIAPKATVQTITTTRDGRTTITLEGDPLRQADIENLIGRKVQIGTVSNAAFIERIA